MVSANIFVLLVIQLSVQVIYAANECQFTSDCGKLEKCINIQDTACVCKFGECVFDGNPFFKNNDCSSYTDCACSRTPDSCFCRDGTCENVAWECRTERDCNKLNKCKSKDCRCSTYNTCEPYDCYTETDCYTGKFFCSTLTDQGYSCKCSKNMCEIVQSNPAPPAPPTPPTPPPPNPVKIVAAPNPECETITGRRCVFPFTYKGKTYKSCTLDETSNGKPWCAYETQRDGNAVPNKWEDCDSSVCQVAKACLTESGPDAGNSCKFPFRFNGQTYNSCARFTWSGQNYGKYWCSTMTDRNGNHVNGQGNYGFCGFCENSACGCGCNQSRIQGAAAAQQDTNIRFGSGSQKAPA